MDGYAWVTDGGIYMILAGRWCKVTQFHAEGRTFAGWGDWERGWECAVYSFARPTPREVPVAEVAPGDFVRIGGAGVWARTTMVNAVLEVTMDPPSKPGPRLLCARTGAWLVDETGVTALGRDGQRTPVARVPDGTDARAYYVLKESILRDPDGLVA